MNDLPVGRSVDETLRLVKAFQVRTALRYLLSDCPAVPEGILLAHQTTCCSVPFAATATAAAAGANLLRICCPHMQFTDEHGEVCPANWRPGAATMKADPQGSMEVCCCVLCATGCVPLPSPSCYPCHMVSALLRRLF